MLGLQDVSKVNFMRWGTKAYFKLGYQLCGVQVIGELALLRKFVVESLISTYLVAELKCRLPASTFRFNLNLFIQESPTVF